MVVRLFIIIVNSFDLVMLVINGLIINGVFVWLMKILVVVESDLGCEVFNSFCKLLFRILII